MKLKYYFNIFIIILSESVMSTVVMPEIRTVVPVSNRDMSRIKCVHGQIGSIDYVAGTGLIHKTHKNNKNTIINFQQLDNGVERKIINSKVNFGIVCNEEYYQLVLDPQALDTQVIFLQVSDTELKAKKTHQQNKNKSKQQILLGLIKRSRQDINYPQLEINDIFIDNLKLKLLGKLEVPGTQYQIKKFVVIANQDILLDEKIFLNTLLSSDTITAISLDDYQLNQEKKYTYLHVVTEKNIPGEL